MANLVFTNDGLDWLMSRAFNPESADAPALAVAIGSGQTAASPTDEELVAETARVSATWVRDGVGAVTVSFEIPAGVGTGAVGELGIFDDEDDEEGVLIARMVVGPFTKGAERAYTGDLVLTGADANA